VPDLLAAADVCVLPSTAEAFGLALVEALYVGTPVVATRVGGIPEIVEDGVDGILVPPADSGALAGTLGTLLQDQARLERLRGAGRERVRTRFGVERMVRQYEELYQELAARRSGVASATANR
jgi:glycosyltransferase involved in cell wall biosynthesis